MENAGIIAQIDAEIGRLQQARALLTSETNGAGTTPKKKRGRPKGSVSQSATKAPEAPKRTLSPEGRKAIADAMKRRWAAKRKASAQ